MATNVFSGRAGSLAVAASSSSAGTKFGGVRDWQFAADSPSIDVVHQNTSGWTERLPGNTKSWSLTCGTVVLSTSATVNQQGTLRAALAADTRKYWVFNDSTAAGGQKFSGWGYVTGFQLAGDVPGNSPQLHTFSIMGDGAYTEA